jgi:hypothetical protein
MTKLTRFVSDGKELGFATALQMRVESRLFRAWDRANIRRRFEAFRALRQIRQRQGRSLSSADKRRCNDYAMEILGSHLFAPWLYFYTAFSGGFKEGWIPENFYDGIVVHRLKGKYGALCDLRALNSVLFSSDAFPDLLGYANGLFFNAHHEVVSRSSVRDFLFRQESIVCFKQDTSAWGDGVHFLTRDTFDIDSICRLGSGLFQRYIRQHGLLAAFHNESVATLRVTTVCDDDGQPAPRAAHLRLGTSDDSHVRIDRQVRIPIDLSSGAFSDVGYTAQWDPMPQHPTSKETFAGKVFPAFTSCLRVACDLHRKVPFARCIGWDLAVDANERVNVMEWNATYNAIRFSEATQGPCFVGLGWENLR